MANSFITIQENERPKKSKTLEKINKQTLADIYQRLNQELALRGGFQSVVQFQVNPNTLNNDTDKKVEVEYFNNAMITRPYIQKNENENIYKN